VGTIGQTSSSEAGSIEEARPKPGLDCHPLLVVEEVCVSLSRIIAFGVAKSELLAFSSAFGPKGGMIATARHASYPVPDAPRVFGVGAWALGEKTKLLACIPDAYGGILSLTLPPQGKEFRL
jgi:hypothetical protein